MGFWSQQKNTPMNEHRLTATDQTKLLRQAKLTKQDISKLKKTIYSNVQGGHGIMNRNRQMSLDEMETVIREYDPKTAEKLKKSFAEYQKNTIGDEPTPEEKHHQKIKENIKKTRGYDLKRERGKEYMKEMLAERKKETLEKEAKEGRSEYHTLEAPTVSASKWKQDSSGTTTSAANKKHETGADKRQTKDFRELQEKAKNLPDLPI